ncbi:hypothetical protein ACFVIM_21315 [Streptomyces sp. NPDC057638]|uniref:hypothetical protein n=1 Tax=Streptomyces sp. NPDC057638 TaxID=3346190 RepID=UPI00367707ED
MSTKARRRVPPPPPHPIPDPPDGGWIGDPEFLTHDELDEICRVTGKSLTELEVTRLWPYAAVAYARRTDAARYPWAVAGMIPLDAVKVGDQDDDGGGTAQAAADAEHAAAVAAAIEAGETPPDPPDPA